MKNKWLVIALVISLSLNLLIAGFVIGRVGSGAGFPVRVDPTAGFPRLLSQLPEERREELRPMMKRYFQTMRPTFRAMRDAQEDVMAAVRALPYESMATQQALASFRDHLLASQKSSHTAFVEFVNSLTPEERAILVKKMHKPPRHRNRHSSIRPGARAPGAVRAPDTFIPPSD